MKRAHAMPFGATVLADGGVRFRLWAPGVDHLTLCLEGDARFERPMAAVAGGWQELTVADAGAGSRYRFRLPDGLLVPDPASRFNPDDVHGASEVIDPLAFDWPDEGWRGRPWHEAVVYELHVGAFSPAGDFAAVERRLDYLAELGVTALEIMPVGDFPGRRNWGYDGALPFAPDASYGRPEDFKRLVAAAHACGLMVILDVVCNHFGPEGNYLHGYCPGFFRPADQTPWGDAIAFDGDGSRGVRDFFVHNACYWIEEFHLDGLRLDAIHAIGDGSRPDIVEEIGAALRDGPGRTRAVHLILENDRNETRYLGRTASAQWNDDFHHAVHVLGTGETDGYYADYAADPIGQLGRCLAAGFAYQGEASPYRGGAPRGEPSAQLPPTAFVNFLQSHDQIGNRARGERLGHLLAPEALEALTALLLLAPQPPMLFMGEEFAADQPFRYFCDFGADLAQAVTEGRRREFSRFAGFADPAARERIPNPGAETSFLASKLDWTAIGRSPHREFLAFCRELLRLRRTEIVPRLVDAPPLAGHAGATRLGDRALSAWWALGDGSRLDLLANLGPDTLVGVAPGSGRRLFATARSGSDAATGAAEPWSVTWTLS